MDNIVMNKIYIHSHHMLNILVDTLHKIDSYFAQKQHNIFEYIKCNKLNLHMINN